MKYIHKFPFSIIHANREEKKTLSKARPVKRNSYTFQNSRSNKMEIYNQQLPMYQVYHYSLSSSPTIDIHPLAHSIFKCIGWWFMETQIWWYCLLLLLLLMDATVRSLGGWEKHESSVHVHTASRIYAQNYILYVQATSHRV